MPDDDWDELTDEDLEIFSDYEEDEDEDEDGFDEPIDPEAHTRRTDTCGIDS